MQDESTSSPETMRAVFTQGGKGGVGKTEIAIALAAWYRANGIRSPCIGMTLVRVEEREAPLKS